MSDVLLRMASPVVAHGITVFKSRAHSFNYKYLHNDNSELSLMSVHLFAFFCMFM